MKPLNFSRNNEEKTVYSDRQDERQKQRPKYKSGDLARSTGFKKALNRGDTTNWSFNLYTVTEIIYTTISFYRINYLSENKMILY